MNRILVLHLLFFFTWLLMQACGDSTTPAWDGDADEQMADSCLDAKNEDPSTIDASDEDYSDVDNEKDAGDQEDAGDTQHADGGYSDAGMDTDDTPGDEEADAGGVTDNADGDAATADTEADAGPPTFVAVTFNTGIHPRVGSDGFTSQQSRYLDQYYGNGLSWGPAIDEAKTFLDSVQPDVVVFQEIFDVDQCQDIPTEARQGFVCEDWSPGSPTVAELILGSGYQVACNWHKHDKCAAVKRRFARFDGCDGDYCPDGLFGSTIPDCGNGARIGRGILDLVGGGSFTLVNVHGSSGVSQDDRQCRVKQVEQVFVDLGDAAPGANGTRNLILGDFNTDPRSPGAVAIDPSARRWNDFVGDSHSFGFLNEYVKTYKNLFCIDNMVSDEFEATCWYPGFTDGHPAVSPEGYFDHTPTVCTITIP